MQADFSTWPLVVTTYPRKATPESLDALRAAFEQSFARREKFIVIADLRPIESVPDAKWRKDCADWLNDPEFKARQIRYNLGNASLLASAPMRAAMTALHWLWKPPTPQAYPRDMPDAVDWCIERLRDAEIAIPDALRRFAAATRAPSAGLRPG